MLPKNLQYNKGKVESSPSKAYRSNIAPINGTGGSGTTGGYGFNDTIIVNIPTGGNRCLVPSESFLKFAVNIKNLNSTANNFRLPSHGIHSIFSRLRIFHGGSLLQDISEYGQLASILFNLQVPTDASMGKFNILCGTTQNMVISDGVNTDFGTDDALTRAEILGGLAKQKVINVNSGELLGSSIAQNSSTSTRLFCVNLISLIGSLCPQYIPLFAMGSAPLRLELTLTDQANKAFCCTNGGNTDASISLTQVEYVAQYVDLSDQAVGMIKDSLGGQPIQFIVPDWRNYAYSYPLTTSINNIITMPINAKFSSVKSIFVVLRDKGQGANTYFPDSSVTCGTTSYQFRLGSTLYPQKAPDSIVEMFSETLKSIGSLGDINHQPSIDLNTYSLSASVSNDESKINVQAGSYIIGLDLENFPGSSKDNLFAGYNSNVEDIFLLLNATPSSSFTVRLDAFALFDTVVVVENNSCYVKF